MLPLLEPLEKREEIAWGLVVVLAMLLYVAGLKLKAANAALAARPAIHTEAEQKVQVVRIAGPVRVEEKIVYKPGTTEIQYVDRVVDRAPVTTTTEKQSDVVKDVKPACPSAPSTPTPWRYAGVALDPTHDLEPRRLEGGVSLGRFDAGGDYDWKYHALGLDVRVHF